MKTSFERTETIREWLINQYGEKCVQRKTVHIWNKDEPWSIPEYTGFIYINGDDIGRCDSSTKFVDGEVWNGKFFQGVYTSSVMTGYAIVNYRNVETNVFGVYFYVWDARWTNETYYVMKSKNSIASGFVGFQNKYDEDWKWKNVVFGELYLDHFNYYTCAVFEDGGHIPLPILLEAYSPGFIRDYNPRSLQLRSIRKRIEMLKNDPYFVGCMTIAMRNYYRG